MGFVYIRDDGTCADGSGEFVSQQTGDFDLLSSALVYPSLDAANTALTGTAQQYFISDRTTPMDDFDSWDLIGVVGDFSRVTVVEDLNCDVPVMHDGINQNADIGPNGGYFRGDWALNGYYLHHSGPTSLRARLVDSHLVFTECKISMTGSNDFVNRYNNRPKLDFVNCELSAGAGASLCVPTEDQRIRLLGGSLSGVKYMFRLVTTNGGGCLIVLDGVECDPTFLSDGFSKVAYHGAVGDLPVRVIVRDCYMSDTIGAEIEEIANSTEYIVTNSGSATKEWQRYEIRRGGFFKHINTIYRDGMPGFSSGIKVSANVVTSTLASAETPFHFENPVGDWPLGDTDSDLLTVNISSPDAALTDHDVYGVLVHPSTVLGGAIPATLQPVEQASNPYRSSSGLTTNAESWTGNAGQTTYELAFDLAGIALQGVPIIDLYFTKPSTNFYVCPYPVFS